MGRECRKDRFLAKGRTGLRSDRLIQGGYGGWHAEGRCWRLGLPALRRVPHLSTLAAFLVWGDLVAWLTRASKGAFHVDAPSMGTYPRGQALIHICG